MPARRNIIGQKFGRAIVFAEAPPKLRRDGYPYYCSWARCDCGTEFITLNTKLISGRTKSCGCLCRERTSAANSTHGHTKNHQRSRTYRAWVDMTKRCRKPSGKDIKNYAERGIKVCEHWENSFENFLADMGECPKGLTLDRYPNNDGNYEPGNVRWATVLQQARNTRKNRVFTVNGLTGCLQELADHFGIYRKTVTTRIKRGWSVEDAFLKPLIRDRKSPCWRNR